jgi:tol-pal system-associated acyl-CoA thioesterase
LIPFVWQARVYWEDTDAGGIVYYANYLRFLERSRTEWLRARGISQLALASDPGLVFSVVALEAQYRRPARLDDLLSISCEPAREGGASILFSQRIWREPLESELLLSASVHVACLDAATLKPRRLPQVIVRELPA